MAVAVKTSDARTQSAPANVQALSLIGLVYLIGSLALVFWVIPQYATSAYQGIGLKLPPYLQATLTGVLMLVAGLILGFVGKGIVGARVNGVRAGIFVSLVATLLIILVGSWFGGILEWVTFDRNAFGSQGKYIGIITAAVFTGFLVVLFLRWFFARGTSKWLQDFEDGGWFSWTSYKPLQGLRVRRGTIIGLLVLGGSGVYTLVSTNALASYQSAVAVRESTEGEKPVPTRPQGFDGWTVGIPFTASITLRPSTQDELVRGLTGPIGDAGPLLKEKAGWDGASTLTLDRWFLRDEINANLDPALYDYVNLDPLASEQYGIPNGIMLKTVFQDKLAKLREEEGQINIDEARDTRRPVPAGNPSGRVDRERLYTSDGNKFVTLSYVPIPLLPHVPYTLPLLLLALTLWGAWRLVNYPPFADFLIATEAEMNKVSWTTRRRLFQDTIVVLVTLLLMAGFLLFVDLACKSVLGNDWIRVIQINPDSAGTTNKGPSPW